MKNDVKAEGPRSPLAPKEFPALPELAGVEVFTAATGMKYQDRDDLLVLHFPEGAAVAGVFTRSKTFSAPVGWCRECLASDNQARALLVNAGNANAFTGQAGDDAVTSMADKAVEIMGCAPDQVYICSTGVIGEALDDGLINRHVQQAFKSDKDSPQNKVQDWQKAARAIRTTDTFAKGASRQAMLEGKAVTLNGIAKGSGMIAPDMATMLAFVVTDASLSADLLQSMLSETNDKSFNAITVDSDTSTSDTALLFATGKSSAGQNITDVNDPRLADFKEKLQEVMTDLAHQVVRDGEGARKFIEITVKGAENDAAAKGIALSIANSPLVKTAIAGEDANWGRIVMAVGKSGEKADRDRLEISFGGEKITEKGRARANYDEAATTAHLKGDEINIAVDVGVGQGEATVWTCDLTHGYITINADYRS